MINSIRYRSYYYDGETGNYYLNSRYYSPEFGRFINADDIINQVGSLYNSNAYAYTDNNPINRMDSGGHFWFQVVGTVVGGLIGAGSQIISNISSGETWYKNTAGAFFGGAFAGLLVTVNPAVGLTTVSYSSAFVESTVNQLVNTGKMDVKTTLLETGWNGTMNFATGTMADNIIKVNPNWIQPQKLETAILGNYNKKLTLNTIVGSIATIIPTPTFNNTTSKTTMIIQPPAGSFNKPSVPSNQPKWCPVIK